MTDKDLAQATMEIEDARTMGEFEDAQIYKYHIDSGVVTKNEVRSDLGLEAVAGGDAPIEIVQPSQSGGE